MAVVTDTIADMLTRIRNANQMRYEEVEIPASNIKKEIARILKEEGFIKDYKVNSEDAQGTIILTLKYTDKKERVITGLKRISKPGLRVYAKGDEIPKVLNGLGIAIISTSKGIMTDIGGVIMSRIGNRIITVPAGVTVEENEGIVTVKGPKGELKQAMLKDITMKQDGTEIILERKNENAKAMHGTMNALINNMIIGVTKGYEKGLEIIGVGYRFNVQGKKLVISAGYSHQVNMDIPEGITVEASSNTEITVKGIDKVLVGEFAANIRKVRQPEPYKGKGIRYKDEHVRRKEGKKAA